MLFTYAWSAGGGGGGGGEGYRNFDISNIIFPPHPVYINNDRSLKPQLSCLLVLQEVTSIKDSYNKKAEIATKESGILVFKD